MGVLVPLILGIVIGVGLLIYFLSQTTPSKQPEFIKESNKSQS